jgi:hypothetical protein
MLDYGCLIFFESDLTHPVPDLPLLDVTENPLISEVDRELVLGRGEVLLYDTANPKFTRYLPGSGTERVYACVRAANQASLEAVRRVMKPIGRLWYLKFWFGRGIVLGNVYLSFRGRASDSCAMRVLDSRSRSAASSDVVGGTLSLNLSDIRSGHAVAARTSSIET